MLNNDKDAAFYKNMIDTLQKEIDKREKIGKPAWYWRDKLTTAKILYRNVCGKR